MIIIDTQNINILILICQIALILCLTVLIMKKSTNITIRSSSPTKNYPTLTRSRSNSPTLQKKKEFRMQAKNFLLTFPQCSMTKEKALENLKSNPNLSLKGVVVAQEKHVDGKDHLHILVCLNERIRTRDPKYWDFVCLKHGDYRTTKDVKKTYEYVTKEDTKPLIFGDIDHMSGKSKVPKSDIAAGMIISGCTVEEVISKMPGYALQNLSKMVTFQSYYINAMSTKSLRSLGLPILYNGTDDASISIIEWLNSNLHTKRPFKMKQLWLHGLPNTGKTSLLMKLQEYMRIYVVPNDEEFYDSYSDDAYDLIAFDEYKAHKKATWLNNFVQGGLNMCIRKKGCQGIKKVNHPVIVCSNYSIAECYSKAMAIDTLSERFIQVHLTSPFDSDNVTWEHPVIEDEPKALDEEGEAEAQNTDPDEPEMDDSKDYASDEGDGPSDDWNGEERVQKKVIYVNVSDSESEDENI